MESNRICNKCKAEKTPSEFSTKYTCKLCWSEDRKLYYKKNKTKILEHQLIYSNNNRHIQKKYYAENKENISLKSKEYYKKNKVKINKQKQICHNNRIKIDNLYKITYNLRRNINISIRGKGYTKKSKTTNILGCSFIDFKKYIESKFESWMNWDNYGKYNGTERYGWDIDHKIPLSTAKSEEDIIRLNHYTNLQPLCSKVNRDIKRGN